MNARNSLLAVYQQWRQLTETEGEAIQLADWPRVGACQEAKQQLQPLIIRFTGEAQDECGKAGKERINMDHEIRAVVDELIHLEHKNSQLVTTKKTEAQRLQAELESSTRNLSRLQHSYAPPRAAVWQSYS